MPRIRALTSWAERKIGEEWEASEQDARVLCAPDLPGGQKAQYVDRSMQAQEQSVAAPASSPEPQGKRRYMRRDLQAQN